MLYHNFLKCLTSGSWQFRGHVYKFISPSLQRYGSFTIDGADDVPFNFEVSYENGQLLLFLNVDNEILSVERYRVLENYCDEKMSLIHEILKEEGVGYQITELELIKLPVNLIVDSKPKTFAYILGKKLHDIFRKAVDPSSATASF